MESDAAKLSEKEKRFIVEIIGKRQRYTLSDLKFLYNDPIALKRYYNTLIKKYKGLPNISPIHDPRWITEAAKWLCEGENVAELGCGDGTFAREVLSCKKCQIKKYFLIDFSDSVLKTAKKSIDPLDKKRICQFRNWNIESLHKKINEGTKIDRIISINTIGDTNPDLVFSEISKVLNRGGLLRATLYSKETFDDFWALDENKSYFKRGDFGLWFTPKGFYGCKDEPMGHIFLGTGFQDFVRIQRYHTKEGWTRTLEHYGFRVDSCKYVTYPQEMVTERWKNVSITDLNPIIKKYNGFPECWDIIARKI